MEKSGLNGRPVSARPTNILFKTNGGNLWGQADAALYPVRDQILHLQSDHLRCFVETT